MSYLLDLSNVVQSIRSLAMFVICLELETETQTIRLIFRFSATSNGYQFQSLHDNKCNPNRVNAEILPSYSNV